MPVNETLNGDKNNNNVETERQQSSEQKSSAENVSEQKQPDDHLANTRVESDHSSIKSISPPSQPIQPQTNPTSLTKNESGSSKIELSQPLVNNQPEEKIKKDDNRLDKSSSIAIELDFNQSSAPSNGRKSTHFEEIRDQPQPSSENNVNESMHDEEMAKHSNTTESIQKLESNSSPQTIVDIQQQEPHSLPPMNSSSSELSHRTISLSDPDLHYMTMPAIVKIDKDKPSTAIDKSIKAMKNQSQPLSATTITKTATHRISFDRQNGIKYSPYSTVRSIRFEQNKPVTSKSMRALSHSSSHQIKLSTAKQHHKSTILKFAPETATLVPIGIEKSRHDISKSTRWKSTNLSHIQMEYNSDSEISDTTFEINNNYLDNNNASDNEAMAILPIEARELLMQDEEDRKSRLAKESTSLLRIPGLGTRRESKFFPGRIRKRVILKNGNINLCPEHVDRRSRRYLQDTFTTMVDIRWRWNLLVFAMGFLGSWLGFSIIWWLIAFSHSDFEHFHDEEWTPCVANLKNFGSAILFSIETQHTIGYGSRYTTEECPEAMFLMMLQSITGVMIQCFMVGFIFAKLSRPQKRSQTLMFSRYAIVNTRDGKMCLMFRVGDLRDRSHIIGAHISAQLIRKKMTTEGEVIPYYHQKLNVKFDEIDDEVFLIWPAIIVHVIDKDSPFYTMNVDDMTREKFEIIAILEGTVESTGQTIQARTSYLPSEILWGHRFEQLIRYRHDTGEYLVDYSKFNNTFDVDTPLCSAKELEEELQQSKNEDSESEHSDDDR